MSYPRGPTRVCMTDRKKEKRRINAENITRRVRAIPQVLQLALSRTNGQTRTVTIQYALTGAMADLLIYSCSVHKYSALSK